MKLLIASMLIIAGFSGCSLNNPNGSFSKSSIQTVDMGKFNRLRTIEIATLTYPATADKTHTNQEFTDQDKENFGDSLLQSLKRSDVRVLPSAQTRIHIDFTKLVIIEDVTGTIITMTADLAVSRNGIVSRKTIDINSKSKLTIGATKDHGIKLFMLELGDLLREQSSFKR